MHPGPRAAAPARCRGPPAGFARVCEAGRELVGTMRAAVHWNWYPDLCCLRALPPPTLPGPPPNTLTRPHHPTHLCIRRSVAAVQEVQHVALRQRLQRALVLRGAAGWQQARVWCACRLWFGCSWPWRGRATAGGSAQRSPVKSAGASNQRCTGCKASHRGGVTQGAGVQAHGAPAALGHEVAQAIKHHGGVCRGGMMQPALRHQEQ